MDTLLQTPRCTALYGSRGGGGKRFACIGVQEEEDWGPGPVELIGVPALLAPGGLGGGC